MPETLATAYNPGMCLLALPVIRWGEKIQFPFFPSPAKYSFTSFTTVPDKRKTAIRFGIAISPLNVSAMLQRSPKLAVAPRIATREYTTMNGLMTFSENRNSMHRAPYSPQPMIVEKAKQHMATAVNKETQLPYVAMNPWIVSSAPASTPYWIGTPLQSTTSAVSVQMTMVSMKTSKIPKNPCLTGFFVSAHAWAMEPVPSPASLEKIPRDTPFFILRNILPTTPPVTADG